ncbi:MULTISPECIES: hypothetical protein [unclassified Rathayibacter]|uniref:hypothetical protein n=1 Tax=unclassified Rathayibacter TaxID=2609250 RepID=UPI0006F732AF|nr:MULTISPECIES: hypothetical protein [unclassified Rathayibacter]KQP97501.1 hypothetical protein ASF42_17595 [Rathayibacter sp. Leaf294]KQS07173.1 hypothetical protein ASG06_18330 [Rathayibacter sp. Leaf185]
MSSLVTRASLRRLSEVLEDPAPINRGHARYVRRLITSVTLAEARPWSGSGATEQLAAIAPDDAAEDPAL